MKHYVQYHSVEGMGHDCLDEPGYGIVTKKNWPSIVGQRVWLIRGVGKVRKRYSLAETFIVDRFRQIPADGRFLYAAEADGGQPGQMKFRPPIEITDQDWFRVLFERASRFRNGLQSVDGYPGVVVGLQETTGMVD